MSWVAELYQKAISDTAQEFSLPAELVRRITDAYYEQKDLDAGARVVLASYQKKLNEIIGPVVAQWADDAAKRDRAKHADRNSGSGRGTKPPAESGSHKQNSRGSKQRNGRGTACVSDCSV